MGHVEKVLPIDDQKNPASFSTYNSYCRRITHCRRGYSYCVTCTIRDRTS